VTKRKIFINYRSKEPDLGLAHNLHRALVKAGHDVFMVAESIDWGENWATRIEQELKDCDYFLLLLSEQSAASDMVAGEVRTAKRLQDQFGKPVFGANPGIPAAFKKLKTVAAWCGSRLLARWARPA
jgi:hypothetical protein